MCSPRARAAESPGTAASPEEGRSVQPERADEDQDECGEAEDADKAAAEADPPECATRGHEAPGWESMLAAPSSHRDRQG